VYASEGGWIAAFPLGVIDGRRRMKRARCRSEADAFRELERLRNEYGTGIDPAMVTLDAYLQGWLAGHRSVRDSTHVSYAGHVRRHISPLLGGIIVSRLRPRDVDRLIVNRLAAGLSPATVGRIVTTLRIALAAGVKRGELRDNPAARVDLPRVEREPVEAMTEVQVDRLVEAFSDHWLGPLVRLLAGSGLRLGEALSLNQGDVGDGFVRIRRSKTTIRAVPISDDAALAVREAMAVAPRRGPSEPLFFGPRRNRHGERDRLAGFTVTHAVPRVLEAAGLPHVTPHGFRHGAATLMVAKGAPMRMVAEQLGHRNPGMTARVYAHVTPEAQRAAVNLLNRRSN
jgi:integrase